MAYKHISLKMSILEILEKNCALEAQYWSKGISVWKKGSPKKKSFLFSGVHFVISGQHTSQWERCQKPSCVVNKHCREKLAERRWLAKQDRERLLIYLFIHSF